MTRVTTYDDGGVYGYHVPAEVTVYLDPTQSHYCLWVRIGDTEVRRMISGQVGEKWRTWFLEHADDDPNPTVSDASSSPSGSSGSSG